jgi:flagellar biosynthesis protein FlhB
MNCEKKSDKENLFSSFIIKYLKDELSNSDIKTEIIKPILIYLLYYIIPFIILFILLNFFTTILAISIVFNYKYIK